MGEEKDGKTGHINSILHNNILLVFWILVLQQLTLVRFSLGTNNEYLNKKISLNFFSNLGFYSVEDNTIGSYARSFYLYRLTANCTKHSYSFRK